GVDILEDSHAVLFVPDDSIPVIAGHEAYESRIDPSVELGTDFSSEPREAVEAAAGRFSGTILLDPELRERYSSAVRKGADTTDFELSGGLLQELRKIKEDREEQLIREASSITDNVVERVRELGEQAIGMTERELACRIDSWLEEEGGEGNAFDTIVAAGPDSSEPHHEVSNREIERGEPVILDFGAMKQGYHSDQTRTVVFGGSPGDKFREVFDIVLEAQEKGIQMAEPGVEGGEIDEKVRQFIADRGYGEEFRHTLGHGLGLEIHEKPTLSQGSEDRLEEGSLVTVEPGIYIEDEFGVRIEDLLLVTADGCERLNRTSREWKL
ncbi:MAG: M24 family metallopeptidase, partial [Candidatus Nanohaloarchaea archaeon]